MSTKHAAHQKHMEMFFWTTINHQEVDFIIGTELAIEIKSTDRITKKHLKGLKLLKEEDICKNYCIVSLDNTINELEGYKIYYWQDFLQLLWSDQII